jgi:hypothetical protein
MHPIVSALNIKLKARKHFAVDVACNGSAKVCSMGSLLKTTCIIAEIAAAFQEIWQ